jgi:hypothetical protein
MSSTPPLAETVPQAMDLLAADLIDHALPEPTFLSLTSRAHQACLSAQGFPQPWPVSLLSCWPRPTLLRDGR